MSEPSVAEGHCRVCGRPLETRESIAAGIGPVCSNKEHLIQSATPPEVLSEPPEGYIPITDVWQKLSDLGIPGIRFTKAIGGDRSLETVRGPEFVPVYVGGRRKRFFPKEVLDKLPELLLEGRGKPKKTRKRMKATPGRPKKPAKPELEFDKDGHAILADVPVNRRLYRVLTDKYDLLGNRVTLNQFQAFQREVGREEVKLIQKGHGWYDEDGVLVLIP